MSESREQVARELIWRDSFDDCTVEQWYALVKSLDENAFWAGGKHRGDCTHDAFTCHCCIYEDIVKRAEPLARALAACALSEAKWWHEQACERVQDEHGNWICWGCDRIDELERAAEGTTNG